MSQETTIAVFKKFQQSWVEQLKDRLNQLRFAQNHHRNSNTGEGELLREAVERVMELCREYTRAKRAITDKDVIGVLAAPWSSALERSLYWVGGWRPTTLFHLVYTESSILFESRIVDILRGLRTGDLSDLSSSQFRFFFGFNNKIINSGYTKPLATLFTNKLLSWSSCYCLCTKTQKHGYTYSYKEISFELFFLPEVPFRKCYKIFERGVKNTFC